LKNVQFEGGIMRTRIVKIVKGLSLSMVGALGFMLMGCGGPGKTIPLSVIMDAVSTSENAAAPLRVAVVPFEDMRSVKSRIGRYQHYSEGTVDTLVPARQMS
jgi:ABC-type dipeptide/oligopeptide/nickel transport system ATPase component